MGIDIMFGEDGFYDMVVGHTRASRDKLFETMDEAERKMREEGIHSIALLEHNGLKIKYNGSGPLGHEMTVEYYPGTGLVESVGADGLSKGFSEILGERVSRQEAVDRTQTTLETYLAAPAPVIEPPKGIVGRMIDYVISKF